MVIQSQRVWVLNSWIKAQVVINEGRIERITPYDSLPVDEDYGSKRMVPGFIDVHTHGAYGWDTNDATPDGLRKWVENIVSEGVTGLLPTTITQSEEVLTAALKNVADVVDSGYKGAEILGIHFEGPYLSPQFKGAQPEEYCVKPDVEQFKRYLEASGGLIRIITMACERDDGFALTHFASDNGIVVSQGHSSATFEEAQMAIANGARSMTHIHNGMPPYHHREPSLVGAAYSFPDVYGEIICDGRHSKPQIVRTLFEMKSNDHAVMISDSLLLKGEKTGAKGMFGGNVIELSEEGIAHIEGTQTIAGSTLKINEGLKFLVETAMVPWQAAINSCTINPAAMLRIDDRKGSIQSGKDADICILNDDYSVDAVYARGILHKRFA